MEDAPASSEKGEQIKAEIDDLLDEIDEVLDANAEDFVRSYVQKGGGDPLFVAFVALEATKATKTGGGPGDAGRR